MAPSKTYLLEAPAMDGAIYRMLVVVGGFGWKSQARSSTSSQVHAISRIPMQTQAKQIQTKPSKFEQPRTNQTQTKRTCTNPNPTKQIKANQNTSNQTNSSPNRRHKPKPAETIGLKSTQSQANRSKPFSIWAKTNSTCANHSQATQTKANPSKSQLIQTPKQP